MKIRLSAAAAALFLILSTVAVAAGTRSWSPTAELSAGTLEGVLLDREGTLRLAPAWSAHWGPEPGVVWAIAGRRDGAFAALSAPGRVVWVRPGREPETWYEVPDDGMVAALANAGRGFVAAVSPGGRLVRVERSGEARPLAELAVERIWDLAPDGKGGVWVATGGPGRLVHVSSAGEAKTLYESGQDPLRCLVALPGGGVAAGSAARGIVLRHREGRSFVLYDAPESEVADLAVDADGTLYAALTGKPGKPGKPGTPGTPAAQPKTDANAGAVSKVTVKASGDSGDSKAKEDKRVETTGGALLRIDPNGSFRELWRSRDELPLALAWHDGELVLGSGPKGRIYRVDRDGEAHELMRFPARHVSALAASPDGLLWLGGAGDAWVATLGPGPEASGSYVSPVHDAGFTADWGRVEWQAEGTAAGTMTIDVRAGNTAEPDATWSAWRGLSAAAPAGDEGGAASGLPPARWVQFRARLRSEGGRSPSLRGVTLRYRTHNRAPLISRVVAETPGAVWTLLPNQSQSQRGPVVVDDPVARGVARLNNGAPRGAVRKGYEGGVRTFSWEAIDPDGDRLRYRLELRREGEEAWYTLAEDWPGKFLSWDSRAAPDGIYRVRLVASDAADRPRASALTASRTSAPFRIDHTPPRVSIAAGRCRGSSCRIELEAHDPDGGRILAVEYALDGRDWRPLAAEDGVADEERESYRFELAGEASPLRLHVRVTDEQGNVGGTLGTIEISPR